MWCMWCVESSGSISRISVTCYVCSTWWIAVPVCPNEWLTYPKIQRIGNFGKMTGPRLGHCVLHRPWHILLSVIVSERGGCWLWTVGTLHTKHHLTPHRTLTSPMHQSCLQFPFPITLFHALTVVSVEPLNTYSSLACTMLTVFSCPSNTFVHSPDCRKRYVSMWQQK